MKSLLIHVSEAFDQYRQERRQNHASLRYLHPTVSAPGSPPAATSSSPCSSSPCSSPPRPSARFR